MTKRELMDIAKRIAEDVRTKTYEHWIAQDLPMIYTQVVNGEEVCVEIDALETRPDSLQIGVGVSAMSGKTLCGLSFVPSVGYSVVVYRKGNGETSLG
ncbi:MAG: hypothetical protein ACP5R5_13820 [Armatimonadota bacterium]